MAEPEFDAAVAAQLEEMAALQFTDPELAVIAGGITVAELLRLYRLQVDRGRLLAEAEVRRSLLQLAKQGSSPAQKEFQRLSTAAKRSRPPRVADPG